MMKKQLTTLLSSLVLIMSSFASFSQNPIVCLGTDASVCIGSAIDIDDCNPGSPGMGSQVLQMINPTAVTLSDDSWSPAVAIGFSFSFYGVNYTQATIGSNCLLSFNMANAGGYCPWALGGAGMLPNTTFAPARNAIMPAYSDMNPSLGASPTGAVEYETIGTAPNRRFVVLWRDISSFGCNGDCNYVGLIIYEGSNNIEVHLGEKALCPGWNGGQAIQGTENPAGNVAHITPGRNNSVWAASQEARRWTPTTPGNTSSYTSSQIPYTLVLSPNAALNWGNT